MALSFKPYSEQELQTMTLLSDGIYQFRVISATEEISKKNNPMIKLVLSVYDNNGREHQIWDFLMTHLDSFLFKIKHFCDVTGLLSQYDAGTLNDKDCFGQEGYVKIAIQPEQTGNDGKIYRAKNVVIDYVKQDKIIDPAKAELPFNDDIPF